MWISQERVAMHRASYG